MEDNTRKVMLENMSDKSNEDVLKELDVKTKEAGFPDFLSYFEDRKTKVVRELDNALSEGNDSVFTQDEFNNLVNSFHLDRIQYAELEDTNTYDFFATIKLPEETESKVESIKNGITFALFPEDIPMDDEEDTDKEN